MQGLPTQTAHSAIMPMLPNEDVAGHLGRRARAALITGELVLALGYDADGRERSVFAADAAAVTAEAVNQMARLGRGVIACAVDSVLAGRLQLSLLPRTGLETRPFFLRSVEATTGVSTGISAADRAHTLRAIGNQWAGADKLVSPGHIMPNLIPKGCRADGPLPDAVLPLLRTVGDVRAAAWCDILDEEGEVASHAYARALAQREDMAVLPPSGSRSPLWDARCLG